MRNRIFNKRKTAAAFAIMLAVRFLLLPLEAAAGTPYTGATNEYTKVVRKRIMNYDYNYSINETGESSTFETNGVRKFNSVDFRMKPTGADWIWFEKPHVVTCDVCKDVVDPDSTYTTRIYIENDNGYEYISDTGLELTESDLKRSGLNFPNLQSAVRIALELTQIPSDYVCPNCGRHVGDLIEVEGPSYRYRAVKWTVNPTSVTAVPGNTVTFDANAESQNQDYRWATRENGEWVQLQDETRASGETYSGTGTKRLTIKNINSQLRGREYACSVTGVWDRAAYSAPATLNMPEDPAPTLTPTPTPTPTPTQPPVTPTPVPVTPTPTPPPDDPSGGNVIKPGSGGSTSYVPSSSSSSYVPQPGSGGTSTRPNSSSTSSTSHSGGGGNGGGGGTYSGSISTGGNLGEDTKILANDPSAGGTGNGSGGKGGNTSKGGTAKGGASKGSSSSSMRSSTGSSAGSGKGYITRNGILYIVDDENDSGGMGTEGELSGDKGDPSETVEKEQEYSAADLAVDGQLKEQEMTKGFFDTVLGKVVIVAAALVLLLLALFLLFFGVIVFGEVEEHDEVFELCAIRIVTRKDGNWNIKLGSAFDDNAVLKLRMGLLFASMFEEWDINGETAGMYEGAITGVIQQPVMLYRKNIRRSV